jgi:hypothetical protein
MSSNYKEYKQDEIFSSNRRKLIYLFAPEQLYLINEQSSHFVRRKSTKSNINAHRQSRLEFPSHVVVPLSILRVFPAWPTVGLCPGGDLACPVVKTKSIVRTDVTTVEG